jgi:hypothetical protein
VASRCLGDVVTPLSPLRKPAWTAASRPNREPLVSQSDPSERTVLPHTHGATSEAKIAPLARNHRRRIMRQPRLSPRELDAPARGYLQLYVRTAADRLVRHRWDVAQLPAVGGPDRDRGPDQQGEVRRDRPRLDQPGAVQGRLESGDVRGRLLRHRAHGRGRCRQQQPRRPRRPGLPGDAGLGSGDGTWHPECGGAAPGSRRRDAQLGVRVRASALPEHAAQLAISVPVANLTDRHYEENRLRRRGCAGHRVLSRLDRGQEGAGLPFWFCSSLPPAWSSCSAR